MKKKLIAVALAATTTLSVAPFAVADSEKVEISFSVGESILNINGVGTEVETPYVTDSGVTLVPLRVITEAFGAQVDWNGSTKEITLTYPDVNIGLQIDNIAATVNDHTETLLSAPSLSQNGVTMVPLRFISETFGADVGYDNETQAILVTKETLDNSSTVTGITEMTKTGDSYYTWSIDTPTQMKMTDRRLDGLSTTFTADDESELYIDIFHVTSSTPSFDEEFSKMKDSFSDYTLTNAEKLTTADGTQYMLIQAKSKDGIIDLREYYTDKYRYKIISVIENNDDSTSIKDMVLSVADSFVIGKIDKETYDLSTVKNLGSDQYREIKDDTYKVSFKVPANYQMSTSSSSENEFRFFNTDEDSNAGISLGIYSKNSEISAYSLATNDYNSRVDNANPKFATFTGVSETGENSYKYTHTVSGTENRNFYTVDSFFEKGDYVYNFSVTLDNAEDTSLLNDILESLKTEELDSSKIGKIMRNDPDDTPVSVKVDDYQFTLPTSWKLSLKTTQGAVYSHRLTNSSISYTTMSDSEFQKGNLSALAINLKNSLEARDKTEISGSIEYTTINKMRFAYLTYTALENDETIYGTVYMTFANGKAYVFTLMQEEIHYNSKEMDTFMAAIKSFEKQ